MFVLLFQKQENDIACTLQSNILDLTKKRWKIFGQQSWTKLLRHFTKLSLVCDTKANIFNPPSLPHFNVNFVMLRKQSWVNCKPQETTLNRGRRKLNILYSPVSQDMREKCVISVCLSWCCPKAVVISNTYLTTRVSMANCFIDVEKLTFFTYLNDNESQL